MRGFFQGFLAAALFVASIVSMTNGNFLPAVALFAGAMVFGWHAVSGKAWSNWGEAEAKMDFFRNPAGSIVDFVAGSGDEDDAPSDGANAAPFDPEAALARYLEKKAAGKVEPVTGSYGGEVQAPAPRAVFGRKAG